MPQVFQSVLRCSQCHKIFRRASGCIRHKCSGKPSQRVTASNTAYTAALEDIIKWLDGSKGLFPIRNPGEGAYYWRKEMTKRLNAAKARHCV